MIFERQIGDETASYMSTAWELCVTEPMYLVIPPNQSLCACTLGTMKLTSYPCTTAAVASIDYTPSTKKNRGCSP